MITLISPNKLFSSEGIPMHYKKWENYKEAQNGCDRGTN